MQSWTRQPTQCVFCIFRQARKTAPFNRVQRRNDSAYVSIRKNRPRNHYRDDYDSPRNAGRSVKATGREFKGRSDGKRGRKSIIRYTDDDERHRSNMMQGLSTQITNALSIVKKRLESTTVPFDREEKNELQALDPTGVKWRAYEDEVSILSSQDRDSLMGQLYGRVRKMWTDRWTTSKKAHLQTELYLGFLDYAIPAISAAREGGSGVDIRYPTEWYAKARQSQRTIFLHVGPTNSGKTYNALKRLTEAKSGFYAGPLRLLAHEVYSRFKAKGTPCDLVTGDDVRLDEDPDTAIAASTVEMVNTSKEVEVAVIDEIQMMAEEQRGWAWTRAFLGSNAKEVHLCGEERVVPLIRELAASMGDKLIIQHYERLNPLRCMTKSLGGDLKALQKGDCVVAFSIIELHAMKKEIELATGRRCAIVYGGLPPETRAKQAELFNDPENDYDYLVASDAIGMGLNLAVRRIVFNSVQKFNNGSNQELTVPHIKQIAGRAGRYRSAHQDNTGAGKVEQSAGLVTCLHEADLPVIRAALSVNAPPIQKAGIIPPAEYLEEVSLKLPIEAPFEFLMRKVSREANVHSRFFLCNIEDKLRIARHIDDVKDLSIEQRVNLCAAPCGRKPLVVNCFRSLAQVIAKGKAINCADAKGIPLELFTATPVAEPSYLENLEALHQCLVMYLWLSYRFPQILLDQAMAIHAKELVEQKITWTLKAFSAHPKLREHLDKKTLKAAATLSFEEALDQGKQRALEAASSPKEQTDIKEDMDLREQDRAASINLGHVDGLDLSDEQARDLGEYEREPTLRMQEPMAPEDSSNSEPLIMPAEDQVSHGELANISTLTIDPADFIRDDDLPSAEGESGEILDLTPSEQVQEAVNFKDLQHPKEDDVIVSSHDSDADRDAQSASDEGQRKASGSG